MGILDKITTDRLPPRWLVECTGCGARVVTGDDYTAHPERWSACAAWCRGRELIVARCGGERG